MPDKTPHTTSLDTAALVVKAHICRTLMSDGQKRRRGDDFCFNQPLLHRCYCEVLKVIISRKFFPGERMSLPSSFPGFPPIRPEQGAIIDEPDSPTRARPTTAVRTFSTSSLRKSSTGITIEGLDNTMPGSSFHHLRTKMKESMSVSQL
ncbi:uncharacterized protein ARMOST_02239 [Armillaria ostoyae]|uniref:Uncharacterized protein n=1 Tax=Armillaria ostoyae TaxID=47428 RepID=A0A284QR63_ARMOS|nr:uncharacterized protein ARMOST_02239 [Armillaria ostoyae]